MSPNQDPKSAAALSKTEILPTAMPTSPTPSMQPNALPAQPLRPVARGAIARTFGADLIASLDDEDSVAGLRQSLASSEVEHAAALTESQGIAPAPGSLYAQAAPTDAAAPPATSSVPVTATPTPGTEGAVAAPGMSMTTIGLIAAGVGLAAAGGGGGGSKSSGDPVAGPPPGAPPAPPPPAAPNAPPAPTIATVATDDRVNGGERADGVTVTGVGDAGAILTVTWGSTSKTATVNGAGQWTVAFSAGEVPGNEGASTMFAKVSVAGVESSIASRAVTIDTVAPTAPTVTVSAAGIVSGTSSAGNTVRLDSNGDGVVDATDTTVTADPDGKFSFPAAMTNDKTISVVAWDPAGNKSAVGGVSAPIAPTINLVSADDLINGAERSAGLTLTGEGVAGASLSVSWGLASKTTTVDSAGKWSAGFAAADIPSVQGATTISATETRFGLTSTAATRSVSIDTIAPAAPTVAINSAGIVSGTSSAAGDKITIDSNGDGVADATTTAGAGGVFTFTSAFTSGQTLSIVATDTAGNKSAGVSKVAPSSNFGTGANDTMNGGTGADLISGGAGNDLIAGGAGSDQLFGGSAASIRNYQFESWDITGSKAAGIWDNGLVSGNYAFINPGVTDVEVIGWIAGPYQNIQSRVFGTGASAVTQWVGRPNTLGPTGDDHNPPVVEYRSTTANAAIDTPDTSGLGGRFLLDTVFIPAQGGTQIYQSVITNPNAGYTLTIQASNPDASNNSMVVTWKGAELAVYDAITNVWSGTAPTVTAGNSAGHVNLSWAVTGSAASGSTTLDIKVYGTLTDPTSSKTLRLDSVTLDSTVVDGDDRLVGGAGRDILFGQAGDDTLYGGGFDPVSGALTPDNAGDAFVYSMRTGNGNDVIKDFQVGSDRISLIDLVDSHLGAGVWNAATNPTASRTPQPVIESAPGVFTQPAGTTNIGDNNLNYRDLLQADSANQYLSVASDGSAANHLRITLHGAGGAAIGSIVLEGVQFGGGAGQYDTVQDLLGSGYMDRTIAPPAGSPTQILWLTLDGYNANTLLV